VATELSVLKLEFHSSWERIPSVGYIFVEADVKEMIVGLLKGKQGIAEVESSKKKRLSYKEEIQG